MRIAPTKLFSILVIVYAALSSMPLRAADDKTVELAKKEGRVAFYTSMGADESKLVADTFQAKYPSIRVEITRLGSERLLQRVVTESRAGSNFFDAVTNSGMEIYLLGKMGLLARHLTPDFSSFMADAKDPAGRWVDMYSNLRLVAYNTKLISKEKIPKLVKTCSIPYGKARSVFPKGSFPGSPRC